MTIDATFWVTISFFIFLGILIYFKIPQKIKESLETKPVNTEAIKQFKWYTKAVDKLRNTDIKTIVPEFEGLFNE